MMSMVKKMIFHALHKNPNFEILHKSYHQFFSSRVQQFAKNILRNQANSQ